MLYSKLPLVALIVMLPLLSIGQLVGATEFTEEMDGLQSVSAQSVFPSLSSSIPLLQISEQFPFAKFVVVEIEQPVSLFFTRIV